MGSGFVGTTASTSTPPSQISAPSLELTCLSLPVSIINGRRVQVSLIPRQPSHLVDPLIILSTPLCRTGMADWQPTSIGTRPSSGNPATPSTLPPPPLSSTSFAQSPFLSSPCGHRTDTVLLPALLSIICHLVLSNNDPRLFTLKRSPDTHAFSVPLCHNRSISSRSVRPSCVPVVFL